MPSYSPHRVTEKKLRSFIRGELYRNGFLNENRLFRALDKKTRFNRSTVFTMLESGFFTLEEEAALKVALRLDRFKYVNEAFVERFDKRLSVLNESTTLEDELFAEAFGDFLGKLKDKVVGGARAAKEKVADAGAALKSKAGDLMAKAKEALAGGWEKLKTIWKNFSDVIKQLCSMIVNGLKKLWDMTKSKAVSLGAKAKDVTLKKVAAIKDKAKMARLSKEASHASEMADFWNDSVYSEWIVGNKWVNQTIAGEGNPEEGSETKTESRNLSGSLDFSDPFVLDQIYKRFGSRVLKESGGKHILELESFVKNKVGHNIIKYGVKLIQTLFTPVAFVIKEATALGTNKGLNTASSITEKMGGPAAIEYALLGLILGEVLATVTEGLAAAHLAPQAVAGAMHFAILGLAAPQILGFIHIVQGVLLAYGAVVCIANIADAISGGKLTTAVSGSDHGSKH